MKFSTLVAIIFGGAALILMLLASKSCAESIAQSKKDSMRHDTVTTAGIPQLTEDYTYAPDGYSEPPVTAPEEDTTEREYVTVTNIFGDVVDTIPVTTPEEAMIPTTTLSILEEYEQNSRKDKEGADMPESTTKYIEPETNITLIIG